MSAQKRETTEKKSVLSRIKTPLIIMGVFWTIAITLWLTTGILFYLFNFLYIGTSICVGMSLFMLLPRNKKNRGRKLSQVLVGGYLLGILGFLAHENMQIEGFFFFLLAGITGGAVLHYTIAKIIGPMIFNRAWCGWTCWTAMVLDYLPFSRNKNGRLPSKWGALRYVHFGISLGLVLVLWFGLAYHPKPLGMTDLYWLAGGNTLYYISAVVLAFALKDNRAFCKYVCPITTLFKTTSRLSLWKMRADPEKCTNCGACEKICPMDIRITEYTKRGQRVLSTECIMCTQCEHTCPQSAIKSSWGFDCGTKELLRMKIEMTKVK